MTDSASYKDIYKQLKAIFDGCDTIVDAIQFGNMYIKKYPNMESMIVSYMNGRSYRDTVDIKTKQASLNDVHHCSTRDDALALISKLSDKTLDDVYKKTLERIAYRKNYKKLEAKRIDTTPNVSKKCPHCGHVLNMTENTQYVICGYHNPNVGYDWNGCGRDWCFQCEKKLCKRWEVDALHLRINRHHDGDCCEKHAQDNGNKYPDDYCQCNNMNILHTFIN